MRLTTTAGTTLVLLALMATQSGCVKLKKDYPAKRYYSLEVEREGEGQAALRGASLTIRDFQKSVVGNREFLYQMGPSRYETDFYNEFIVDPEALITDQTERWLTDANLFEHVIEQSSLARATHVLEGAITKLEADLSEPGAPAAVIELQFFLIDNTSPKTSVILHESYRSDFPSASCEPDDLVAAWEQGLAAILKQMENDIAKTQGRRIPR